MILRYQRRMSEGLFTLSRGGEEGEGRAADE
jgi:hypothetical protein